MFPSAPKRRKLDSKLPVPSSFGSQASSSTVSVSPDQATGTSSLQCGKPGKPEALGFGSPIKIAVKWKIPATTTTIEHYVLKTLSNRVFNEQLFNYVTDREHCVAEIDYMPGSKCRFTITPFYSKEGYGPASDESDLFCLTATEEEIKRARSLPSSNVPIGKPGKPEVSGLSPLNIKLKWKQPAVATIMQIHSYGVKVKSEANENGYTLPSYKIDGDYIIAETDSIPNVKCLYTIIAHFGSKENSFESDPSEEFYLEVSKEELLHAKLQKDCESTTGIPRVYTLNLSKVISLENDKIRKYCLGQNDHKATEKVIMVVGATGSGKTTLINGMVNYILGVKWEDPFRYKMIVEGHAGQQANQALSQTSGISAYTLYHQDGFKVPYTLTIIDTPGFGDTSGINRDRVITGEIRKFFTAGGETGVDHIDAVAFIVQSSLPRLTTTQKYIFDQILSLFGKDIEGNIFMLLTFADGQTPQVLSGLKEANLPYKNSFKFNSSALYVVNADIGSELGQLDQNEDCTSEDEGASYGNISFNRMFWEMGELSFKAFLKQLNSVQCQSLSLTKEVLQERERIETSVVGIRKDIRLGINKLEILVKEIEILKTHQADIDRNRNFTYKVEEDTAEQVELPIGDHITNCLVCNFTCHYPCMYTDDQDKQHCAAMEGENCVVCMNKCHWSQHKNMKYKIEYARTTVTKTSDDLLNRYAEAGKKKATVEQAVREAVYEFANLQTQILDMTEEVRNSLQRLGQIALKPNPLSAIQYIDILIQSEQNETSPGWQQRIEQLTAMRKQTEYLQQVTDDDFDPFKDYMSQVMKNGLGSISEEIQSFVDPSIGPLVTRMKKRGGKGRSQGQYSNRFNKMLPNK